MNGKNILGLSPEVHQILSNYPWPGNVRELENVVERAVSLCTAQTIELSDLPPRLKLESTIERAVSLGQTQEIEMPVVPLPRPDAPFAGSYLVIPLGISLDKIEQIGPG